MSASLFIEYLKPQTQSDLQKVLKDISCLKVIFDGGKHQRSFWFRSTRRGTNWTADGRVLYFV